MRLTIDGMKVPMSADRVAVPVEFSSTELQEVAERGWVTWFSDDSGATLASETVGFAPQSGRLQAWVQWPALVAETESAIWFNAGPAERAPQIPAMWADYSGVWHFETSSRPKDSSPNRNDGMSSGLTLADQEEGVIGTAPAFGNDDVILIPDDDSLRMQSFTLMMWVKRGDDENNMTLINKDYPEQTEVSFGLQIVANGLLRGWGTPAGTMDRHTFEAPMGEATLDTWHHVAMTRTEEESVRLYLDGVKVHDQAFIQPIGYDEGDLVLGRRVDHGDQLRGVLDEVMVLPSAMDGDWIAMSRLAQDKNDLVEVGALEEVESVCD